MDRQGRPHVVFVIVNFVSCRPGPRPDASWLDAQRESIGNDNLCPWTHKPGKQNDDYYSILYLNLVFLN